MCFFRRKRLLAEQKALSEKVDELLKELERTRDSINATVNNTVNTAVNVSNTALTNTTKDTLDLFGKNIDAALANNEKRMEEMRATIDKNLSEIKDNNEKRLSEMKQVVEEKLTATLNERLSQTFKAISERLDEVNKGLGEMRNLTTGVTDLKKMLGNVKTRGVFGEVSLRNILENILTEEQYACQFNLSGREDDGRRVVDFAVILPGQSKEDKVYLPIDAKFPLEDYQRLVSAADEGDKQKTEEASKALVNAIKIQAKSIKENYIIPPKTVNFALMYLPIEGLYAEVVRNAGLLEELREKYKIIPAGPTTISALLNSLQIGFKTLAIQRSSKEIYESLIKFRGDFAKFTELLEKAQSQISLAGRTLDDATKRTNTIIKKLDKVESLTPPEDGELV